MSTVRRRMIGGKSKILNYLTFTALEPGTFTLNIPADLGVSDLEYIEYSTDGTSWTKTNNADATAITITTPTINTGDIVYWRGIGTRYAVDNSIYSYFSSTGQFDISGNIISLTKRKACEKPVSSVATFIFSRLFLECTELVNAKDCIIPNKVAANCYSHLFDGCTSLISVPELSATSLANYCYEYMFSGCTSLNDSPTLSAMTLSEGCYYAMFNECSSLVTAPNLPATVLKKKCYQGMFINCTSLINVSKLPALTLLTSSYAYMFSGCTSLVTAPEIDATTDNGGTYSYCTEYMFNGCTSLVTASEFKITNSNYYSFRYMYQNCTSLVNAPSKIEQSKPGYASFDSMFRGCTSLITAPKIKITTGGQSTLNNMFYGCTSLVNVQDIEIGTVPNNNYYTHHMFQGCTSLKTAPKLPSTTITKYNYVEMFKNCSTLNYVFMLAINISSFTAGGGPTYNWMNGVQNVSGIFVKHIDATWTQTGSHGVPSNWTIIYYDPALDKYYTDQTRAQECDDHGNPI